MLSPIANYTPEELKEYYDIGAVDQGNTTERRPYYRKTGFEYGPTWAQKKEFVHRLMTHSNINLDGKRRLKENYGIIQHYQLRGAKYGAITSAAVFFFLPVVNRQLFLRRFAISMIPMFVFLRWGYIWGHQHWWRKSYPVITTYEVVAGLRNQFTGK
ncbi:unnamed protein product [Moneuplotes crassus]|uniref:Uncharacterized protein n=2 Tax=Euplotes crassus TaxID=5936 RepID=A0AAD2D790_EUPCR|nr:unnamed protein product [Moneuplotes crassus]